ncbi:MAG: insulinase family protein, partial [Muribaculaceae bacterium]|nr:insulinase family protein [Muribaculaceae bacterium]
ISFKEEKMPFEYRNTVEAYIQHDLVRNIVSALINNRLQENAVNPDCKYSGAGVYFGDIYLSKTKDSFNVVTIPQRGTQGAVAEVMGIVARACKTGFTDSELERVKSNILSSYEKTYNEREKTDNDAYGSELCRTFVDNEPNPGIEKEYEMLKQVLPMIPVEGINGFAAGLLTSNNMVVVTSEPQKEGFEVVAEDVMIKTINDAMNASYEAFVDEVIIEPLIAKLPKKGKVVAVEEEKGIGAKTYILSNGAKVVVKATDFAADEILMSAFRNGGKRSFSKDQASNVNMLSTAFNCSKFGPFDAKQLKKYLTGKNVDISFGTTTTLDILGGQSTVKDLPVFMELLYTAFTNLSADKATYDVARENIAQRLKNAYQNPQMIFSHRVSMVRYGNNPMMETMTPESVEGADYDKMLEILHSALGNAADYTFVFTGNIDEKEFLPLVDQYIASLPSGKVNEAEILTPIETPKGEIVDRFKQPMQTPGTTVFDIYSGYNLDINVKNEVMIGMLGDILDNIYIRTLREEEGGTYGASVSGFLNYNNASWNLIYRFQTNKEQQEKLITRAQEELEKLLNDGASVEDFTKVKEAMLKQLEINVRKNSYWDDGIVDYLRGFDMLTGHKEAIESVTLDSLNSFMKNLYDGKNRIQIIMEGVPAEEK